MFWKKITIFTKHNRIKVIKTKTEVSIYTIVENEIFEQKMIYCSHLISNQNKDLWKETLLDM